MRRKTRAPNRQRRPRRSGFSISPGRQRSRTSRRIARRSKTAHRDARRQTIRPQCSSRVEFEDLAAKVHALTAHQGAVRRAPDPAVAVLAAGGTDDEVLGVGGRFSEISYWRLCVRNGADKGGGEKDGDEAHNFLVCLSDPTPSSLAKCSVIRKSLAEMDHA
jgi:hypothetical protein